MVRGQLAWEWALNCLEEDVVGSKYSHSIHVAENQVLLRKKRCVLLVRFKQNDGIKHANIYNIPNRLCQMGNAVFCPVHGICHVALISRAIQKPC